MSDSSGSPPPLDPVRGVFLGDLAHDLSTPLTAIHGATELLLNGAYGPLDGEQRALMVEVLASARELRAFVQDVADLGALDTGRLVFASAPCGRRGAGRGARLVARRDGRPSAAVTFSSTRSVDGPVESDEPAAAADLHGALRLRGEGLAARQPGHGDRRARGRPPARRGPIHRHHATGDPATLFADRRDATPGVPKPYRGPGLGLPLIGRVVTAWGGRVSAEQRDGALVLGVDVPVR